MSKFENATTYTGRFITDADAVLEVRVIKRTAKTVTFVHPHTGDDTRAKIHNNDDGEFFFPMGQYSMAPVIRADRPLVVAPVELFYNIYAIGTEAFLGTVRVELPTAEDAPAAAARAIACTILGGNGAPKGIKAIMSTADMFAQYGLNREAIKPDWDIAPSDEEHLAGADFELKPTTKGTALIAQNDAAREWIAQTFKMLADPVLDDVGIEMARPMIERAGLTVGEPS
jgi:hypothetical protein